MPAHTAACKVTIEAGYDFEDFRANYKGSLPICSEATQLTAKNPSCVLPSKCLKGYGCDSNGQNCKGGGYFAVGDVNVAVGSNIVTCNTPGSPDAPKMRCVTGVS